ncbi:glycosyl hydrolase family 5 [Flavobacteriales bacterium 34_180_T64]|nr:glycosyl hydrolase family 5 [Flavobacteriales bacterium 34_180_T64]
MVSTNKNILRAALILSYIVVITLLIYGISAIYSYLNMGADRNKMLHTEIKKTDQYLPKVIWAPLANEGRPIDTQTLHDIEDDYLDAWYIKHLAYKTNTSTGIPDYYTESARENLFNHIARNTKEKIHIESTSLLHHPTLEFFSEDGQLAVITDHDVVEYKSIYKDNKIILETTEITTYKVILLLEDGFWRVRHLIKEALSSSTNNIAKAKVSNLMIKGINYYPKESPWDMFGSLFDTEIISKDFKIIKEAGLNSLRIFIPYDDFGKTKVTHGKLEKLKQVLDIAETHQLKVVITLFDFYGDYSVLNWTLNQRHAETIVSTFKNHRALLAWDIKNEPNLDFKSRGKTRVLAWLNSMITLVKSIDPTHAVTIGWSDAKSAYLLKDKVDFVSFHYYKDPDQLEAVFNQLKIDIPNQTIILSEFGLSSYRGLWNPFGHSEEAQASYHKIMQESFDALNIQYMSWTLYDFNNIPKEAVGRLPWRKNAQKRFGFIDKNGRKKGAFKYISSD